MASWREYNYKTGAVSRYAFCFVSPAKQPAVIVQGLQRVVLREYEVVREVHGGRLAPSASRAARPPLEFVLDSTTSSPFCHLESLTVDASFLFGNVKRENAQHNHRVGEVRGLGEGMPCRLSLSRRPWRPRG